MTEALKTTTLGERGPRIAFLHGLFGQGKNWTQAAKALATDHRATLIDLPNHGQSPWTDEFSYAAMADDVERALRAIGGDDRWTVLGHSMGGKVAMLMALGRPELVDRLIVVDMSPVSYGGLTSFDEYIEGMQAMNLAAIRSRSDADHAAQQWVSNPGVRAFLLQNLRRTDHGWHWQMNLDLLGRSLTDLGDWPGWHGDSYDGPVLWVAGEKSDYVKAEYGDEMRRLFPRVRAVTIKGAGHWPHSEKPDVFLSTIRPFIDADRR